MKLRSFKTRETKIVFINHVFRRNQELSESWFSSTLRIRAADRTAVQVTLVANRLLYTPPSPYISAIQVADGFDVADSEIVKRLEAGDLVITADIPLAAEVIAKGGHALDPRGEMHSTDTIQARLMMRDFMDTLRASGVDTGGPSALSQRDRQLFAKHLDYYLTNLVKQKNEKA